MWSLERRLNNMFFILFIDLNTIIIIIIINELKIINLNTNSFNN